MIKKITVAELWIRPNEAIRRTEFEVGNILVKGWLTTRTKEQKESDEYPLRFWNNDTNRGKIGYHTVILPGNAIAWINE